MLKAFLLQIAFEASIFFRDDLLSKLNSRLSSCYQVPVAEKCLELCPSVALIRSVVMPGMELLIKILSHDNGKEKGALISEFFFS